jgi:hypothetical protein
MASGTLLERDKTSSKVYSQSATKHISGFSDDASEFTIGV